MRLPHSRAGSARLAARRAVESGHRPNDAKAVTSTESCYQTVVRQFFCDFLKGSHGCINVGFTVRR